MGRAAEAQAQLSEDLKQLNLSAKKDDTPASILTTLLELAVLVRNRETASLLAKRLLDVARNLGKASVLLGDLTAARANYERVLDWATRIRFRPEIALTRFELAKLLLSEAKDASESDAAAALRSGAQAHLDFAISEFQATKMKPALEQALRTQER